MTRRRFTLALVVGGLLAALPVSAQGLADEIARQMRRQGFGNIDIQSTWLGRTRIIGTRNGGSREIILNPNTGEILRDLWLNAEGQVRAADIDFDQDENPKVDDAPDAPDDGADDNSGSGKGNGGGGEQDGRSDGEGKTGGADD